MTVKCWTLVKKGCRSGGRTMTLVLRSGRYYSYEAAMIVDREQLWTRYKITKDVARSTTRYSAVSPDDIFTNNELDLKQIGVYGFDYDYTIAVYKRELNSLIYELAMQRLIDYFKYPAELAEISYDPQFAIRGLHYDVECGVLMKLDAYCLIQAGTAYRGRMELSTKEVQELYNGSYVPAYYLASPDKTPGSERMKQMLDLFSLPEAGLLSNVTQYFYDHKIDHDHASLYRDVRAAIDGVHSSGDLYAAVNNNFEKYVHRMDGLKEFFERLFANNKIVFLITNSPFTFINVGMSYLIGPNWRDYFHYIVVKARKPKFFKDVKRPFRVYNEETDRLTWEKVTALRRGVIYAEGNLKCFLQKSQIANKGVLYFGDHVYSDLAEPMLTLGWRTGALVPELKREIQIHNTKLYCDRSKWFVTLTALIEYYEDYVATHSEVLEVLNMWKAEREQLRLELKEMFNPKFGSIFRTYHSPTFFSRRLMRLADIYTARLPNLLAVRLDHTFYPRRYALPHETHISVPEIIFRHSQLTSGLPG